MREKKRRKKMSLANSTSFEQKPAILDRFSFLAILLNFLSLTSEGRKAIHFLLSLIEVSGLGS